jgi:dihydroorotase
MTILLRKVLVADPESSYNGLVKDILINNQQIIAISDSIKEHADIVFEEENTLVSSGWIDCFAHFCDPGFEYRETLETGASAAASGGFTSVFILPNTNPTIHSKSQVEYIVQKSKSLPIFVHPLGAVTKNIEGKDLAEMYDMNASGAIAFSDGLYPVQTSGLLLKALQYVKAFKGTIIQMPIDQSIGANGLMNEGVVSTRLGLQGIPSIGEEIMVKRDIDLLRYTESKLHITGISTAKSLALIADAKAEGLNISCSVTPYHLFFCDEDLHDYDTNLKVNPPLRKRADMLALRQGLIDGIIDCISTHHLPQNWDSKVCEFEYAKNGMIGLQSAFAIVNQSIPELSNDAIANVFSKNACKIFGLQGATISENAIANLTLFSKNSTTIISKENNNSKSFNTPFANQTLQGKVIGVVSKGKLLLY